MKELTITMDWAHLDQVLHFLDQEMSAHLLPVKTKMSVEQIAELFFSRAMDHARSTTFRIDCTAARMAAKANGCNEVLDLRQLSHIAQISGIRVVLSENSCMVCWE